MEEIPYLVIRSSLIGNFLRGKIYNFLEIKIFFFGMVSALLTIDVLTMFMLIKGETVILNGSKCRPKKNGRKHENG